MKMFDNLDIEKIADESEFKLDSKKFVDQIINDSETLFRASEDQVEAYYKSITDKKQLVKHFQGRMVCERMNLVEICEAIANAPVDMDPKELQLLSKQALDEAHHFRLVKGVVEYLGGEEVDMAAAVEYELTKNREIKGAKLLDKYNCQEDEIALGVYQLLAEGRAARNWQKMADTVEDEFIAESYARIAKDERFHSKLGRRRLMQLCDTLEKQQHALKIAEQMRLDLFEINCKNTVELESSLAMMKDAYGYEKAVA
jgi:1,2-phenylacetyl-CoA epoxidase catalytic subunit